MADELTAVNPDPARGGGLPTGTVTFLFTDIEGSTRLLRELRNDYGSALADHRRLLRAAFKAHGGHEVDTQGDSFFVAFPTSSEAVAAVVQAQQTLRDHRWPGGRRLLVRMGLHSGEATVEDGSYVGLDVHRAARIAAAAHGGQVLLSGATAALLADHLPDGTALRPLGEHGLKDFPRPTPLFQLDVPGLPTRYPPLLTTTRRRLLPVPPGALLGRDGDVTLLAALLRDARTRLVTVTGAGGIGKTRLAVETASTVADDFPGGLIFVPLSSVVDAQHVLSTLAEAVGARPEPGGDIVDAVRAALGSERTLLVLDNFEQVIAARADVARLLDEIPTSVALVTSRQVLRLRFEQQYPLAPLTETPSERLFAERAAAVLPGFTLDATNTPAVAEICRLLDRLPLAIELAAARIRLLPPDALLARLRERLDTIGGGSVDLPERQRTLRGTMDWSFGLLRPHEQAALARLGVFSGGWTLAAAETVCGHPGEPDVLDTLSALLDASLLVTVEEYEAEPRFDMLATIRAYAAEKLAASTDRIDTERRHTDWLLGMAERLQAARGREYRTAAERLDREWPNLRAVMQRAIKGGDVATVSLLIRDTFSYRRRRDDPHGREAMAWLDHAMPRAENAPPAVRGRLIVLRALVGGLSGDFTAVRSVPVGRALIPDDTEHALDQAVAAVASAMYAVVERSPDGAAHFIQEALDRFIGLGNEAGQARMRLAAGDLALGLGDLEASQQHYAAAAELADRMGDDTLLGQTLSMRGLVLLAQARPDQVDDAREAILSGVDANRRGGQPSNTAYSLEGLAAVALTDGRPAVAARALAAAAGVHLAAPLSAVLPLLVAPLAARARERLGDEAYEVACAEGRQWPLSDALEQTLAALTNAGGRREAVIETRTDGDGGTPE